MSKIVNQYGRAYASTSEYEGASSTIRMSSLLNSNVGPNSALFGSLSSLRGRSRQLIRNNANASGADDTFVSNLIGSGITPRFQIEDTSIKKQLQELWIDSIAELDFDGIVNFYGLQSLVGHALFDAGECFVLFKPRKRSINLAVPLQIQIVEADHLDESYSTPLQNGHTVKMGIEYNKIGQRCAYWLWKNHPGESFVMNGNEANQRVRVSARNCLHIFEPLRPGQQRGRPRLSSVIVKLHEIDQCVDAELVRRKVTALFGGFFTQPVDSDDIPKYFGDTETDDDGYDIPAMEPGTFVGLPPGVDVTFSEPKDVGGNYVAWMKQQMLDTARGLNLTYEQFTGDLDGVTYGSIRAGLLEYRRSCEKLQKQIIIHQFCKPVIERWMATAVLSGVIKIPDYADDLRKYKRSVAWQPQPWKWIDPLKDIKGEKEEIKGGLKSRTISLQERGIDIEHLDAEIARDNARADSLGLVFDSDGRHDVEVVPEEKEEKDE